MGMARLGCALVMLAVAGCAGATDAPVARAGAGCMVEEAVAQEISPSLERARASLEEAVTAASEAAGGGRQWSEVETDRAGAVFRMDALSLGAGDCAAALEAAGAASLSEGGGEGASAEASPATMGADGLTDAFEAWLGATDEDKEAVARLVAGVRSAVAADHALEPFVLKAGHGTVRAAGVALVDGAAGQALWINARAVRMSAHRR